MGRVGIGQILVLLFLGFLIFGDVTSMKKKIKKTTNLFETLIDNFVVCFQKDTIATCKRKSLCNNLSVF